MSKLLASVRSLDEAHAVSAAPADVLDLKDPRHGALGALDIETVHRIVKLFSGKYPLSATVGDLPADPKIISRRIVELADAGIDYIKIGFFDTAHFESCAGPLQPLAKRHALIGVLFADRLNDFEGPCRLLKTAAFTGVMLDTADKSKGSICEIIDQPGLRRFVDTAHELSLLCGIAGSLTLSDIDSLVSLDPDYLGFRTALCRNGQRNHPICAKTAAEVAEKLRDANRRRAGINGNTPLTSSFDDQLAS